MTRSTHDEPAAAASPATAARLPWKAPRLARMGTVAELTSRVDVIGRNDGGSGTKKRT